MNPMFVLFALAGAGLLFAGSLLALEVGRRIGTRHLAAEKDKANVGLGTVEGAIFGLMGLLLAFTFSSSLTGFDLRRQLIVDEANAINTAYARLDVLPAETQSTLRDLFRQYLSARIDVYRSPASMSTITCSPTSAAACNRHALWEDGRIRARSVRAQGHYFGLMGAATCLLSGPPIADAFDASRFAVASFKSAIYLYLSKTMR